MDLLNTIFKIRAIINRGLNPRKSYYLAKKNVKPISGKFGFDRGRPIDRFFIENFMEMSKKYVKGRILEITDNNYSLKYGEERVAKVDVLDINPKNKKANIIGDLRNLKAQVKSNTYDTIILTHVLGLIDDIGAVLTECNRILKPGGTLLFTGSSLGPVLENNEVYWRFTENSVKYIMKRYFKPKKLYVKSYGNALVGQAFFVGMAQEDLTDKELSYEDKRFPCVVSAIVIK